MRQFTRISLVFWSSAVIALSGCQNRAPSLRMLDVRAGYDSAAEEEEVGLYQRNRSGGETVARRSAPRVARVWIYPHELPSRDYFWGGFVSLIVSEDTWVFDNGEEADAIPDGFAVSDEGDSSPVERPSRGVERP